VSHFGRTSLWDSWIARNIRDLARKEGVLEAFNARIRRFAVAWVSQLGIRFLRINAGREWYGDRPLAQDAAEAPPHP